MNRNNLPWILGTAVVVVVCIALVCIGGGYVIQNIVMKQPQALPTQQVLQGNLPPTPGTAGNSASTPAPQQALNKYNAALQSAGNDNVDQHNSRLYELETKYIVRDSSGVPTEDSLKKWMNQAGITWSTIERQARQPEEETVILANGGNRKKLVAGLQIKAQNLHAKYPGCFTTDRRFSLDTDGKALKIAQDNPSYLVTNGSVSDTATVYASCLNWPNLLTEGSSTVTPSTNTTTGSQCPTITQLDAKYGIDRNALGAKNGLLFDGNTLSGAVIKLTPAQESELSTLGWTIQGSNPNVKSAWSPESCRPLAQ